MKTLIRACYLILFLTFLAAVPVRADVQLRVKEHLTETQDGKPIPVEKQVVQLTEGGTQVTLPYTLFQSYFGGQVTPRAKQFKVKQTKDSATGKITNEEIFKDGKLILSRIYYPNTRQVSVETEYQDGRRTGALREYSEDGKLSSIENYKNGRKEGLEIEYDPVTGNPVKRVVYRDGLKNGTYQLMDPETGKVTFEAQYKKDMLGKGYQVRKDGSRKEIKDAQDWTEATAAWTNARGTISRS